MTNIATLRRANVAIVSRLTLLQLMCSELLRKTLGKKPRNKYLLANEARLMHKRVSFRTVIKARCCLLRRDFALGVCGEEIVMPAILRTGDWLGLGVDRL
jgi:hypothetical protein